MNERFTFVILDAMNIGICVLLVSLGIDMNRFQIFMLAIVFACFLAISKLLIGIEKQMMSKKFDKLCERQRKTLEP